MNPILNFLNGGAAGNSEMSLYMRAINAAMRGESAESFLIGLAKEDPRFQGLDFNNLEKTAHDLCQQKGVNENHLINQVQNDLTNIR